MMKNRIICPACRGDGKETCNNPDHGFLEGFMTSRGANESRCPGCGHDPNHKIKYWKNGKWNQNDCEYCCGTGIMTEQEFNIYCDNFEYDEEPNYIEDEN